MDKTREPVRLEVEECFPDSEALGHTPSRRAVAAAAIRGKRVGTRALATARCKIGLVGLLRDGSRRSWVVPNVPSPRQARNSEKKLGKNRGTR
ncbi:hypothetical protein CRG98_034421 [Punica granatum]|uniref:Uncharacterized protein n=1 Tax=Punica granatum TaxID=22663 RepID=A0A2I0IME7_PUNGR|nr:hypothetical protein CRG98_034421 [Punica granatum]